MCGIIKFMSKAQTDLLHHPVAMLYLELCTPCCLINRYLNGDGSAKVSWMGNVTVARGEYITQISAETN